VRAKITDRLLRSLRRRGLVGEIRDTTLPGFSLRAAGPKLIAFSLRYRPPGERHRGGRSRRLTLGHYPKVKLAKARALAAQALRQLARGVDPAATEPPDAAQGASSTLRGLVAEYLVEHPAELGSSFAERHRILERDVLPVLGDRPAADLRRGELAELLAAIVRRGAPVQANRTRSHLSALFTWAVERDLLATNPIAAVRKPHVERGRERVLEVVEIRRAWELFEELPAGLCLSLRFRLATLQRGHEVSTLAPRHVVSPWWTIPAALTKTKRTDHRVYLGPIARALLLEAVEIGLATDELFFPSPSGGPIEKWAPSKAVLGLCRRHGMRRWTPHDLRRTAGTWAPLAGVEDLELSRVLDHTPEGERAAPRVTGTYNRHRYDDVKRRVALTWDAMLSAILEGRDVDQAAAEVRARQASAEGLELLDRPAQSTAR